MKQIITFLLVILMSQTFTGQVLNLAKDKFEQTKTNTRSKLQEKYLDDAGNRHRKPNYQTSLQQRSISSEHKTLDSLEINEWIDGQGIWEPNVKQEFTYDASENIDESLFYIWSSNTSSWQLFSKNEYTFDSNGHLIQIIASYQLSPNIWTLSTKTEYIYNSSGNLMLETNYQWNPIDNIWLNSYKHELTYDNNQNTILDLGYEWFPSINQWVNSYKDEFFYTNNVLTSEINSFWNYGMSQWDYNSQWLYYYSMDQLITEIRNQWDFMTTDWLNESKYDYTYNPDGSLDFEVSQLWNLNSSQWENLYKDDFQYDGNGNLTQEISLEWTGTPGEWVEYRKDEYVFELAFTLADIITPILYLDNVNLSYIPFNNMPIGYFGYDYVNQTWEATDNALFFYSNYNNPLNVEDSNLEELFTVYPNPTKDKLVINSIMPIDAVEIYSVLGEQIKSINSGFDNISLYDLPNGIYLVAIQSGTSKTVKKIIKQ